MGGWNSGRAAVADDLVMLGLMHRWVARPPQLAREPAIIHESGKTQGGRVYLGRNWFERRDGLPVLYSTGTPLKWATPMAC